MLELILEADYTSLMEDDENDEAYGKHQHPECTQEEHSGNSGFGGL